MAEPDNSKVVLPKVLTPDKAEQPVVSKDLDFVKNISEDTGIGPTVRYFFNQVSFDLRDLVLVVGSLLICPTH